MTSIRSQTPTKHIQSRSLHHRLMATSTGRKIALLTINRPDAMNAIDLSMVNKIDRLLMEWNANEQVAAIIIRGSGEGAFSAGGDIRKLYESIQTKGRSRFKYADEFFCAEYRKNFAMHQIIKPIIAWGNGFVMGGGLGLFISANHRIGTETLKLAWPEIRIGLFPDVTATWYLSRLPFPWGHWMGFTGSHMNAEECRQLGLTHYSMSSASWDQMLEAVKKVSWGNNIAENHRQLRLALQPFSSSADQLPQSRLTECESTLKDLFTGTDLTLIFERLVQALATENSGVSLPESTSVSESTRQWLIAGLKNALAGCPATAHLVMHQLRHGMELSLKEAVALELDMAYQSVRHPDFAEGIRAMVVDKDFNPQWQHKTVQAVDHEWVKNLLHSPWSREKHPFHDL